VYQEYILVQDSVGVIPRKAVTMILVL